MPPQITVLLNYLAKLGNTKITFFTQMPYYTTALHQSDCVARTMHQCAVFLKEKLASVMCLIASNIC